MKYLAQVRRVAPLLFAVFTFCWTASIFAANALTIKNGSSAAVTLSDGSTIAMRFTVAADGAISWIGALGRDQWFSPAVSGGTPGPGPGPVPPGPLPPTPVACKLRMVLFYDPLGLEQMTEAQRQIIASAQPGSLRPWCQTNCLANAGQPECRFWPASIVASDVPEQYRPLIMLSATKPGIVVQQGEEGPITRLELPSDAAAAIALLDKLANPPTGPPVGPAADVPKVRGFLIDDSNFRLLVGARPTGYIRPKSNPLPKFSATYPPIPRSQWSALIKEGKGTWIGDLMRAAKVPCKDQDGLGYCWVYASTESDEVIRLLQGQSFVELSPESVGGPVTGWRDQGGSGGDALQQLSDVGACASSFMDSPNSLSRNRWKAGWEADSPITKSRPPGPRLTTTVSMA